jgi:3' terminal RNA ribose 2'-O-methyltransferase Hen1
VLLTITTTHKPATDLGFLLHKNPANVQTFSLPFGKAHVFYPEASEESCTAALLLDIDPIQLVRGKGGRGESVSLQQYVNDRPYVASSFMSVALVHVFGTALGGRSAAREALAATPIPLEARIAVLPARGGEPLLRRLFEPLGYTMYVERLPLDERFPDWGESRYYDVRISGTVRLQELLTHLYVLIPVLDDEKHYWVDEAEVEKLLRRGDEWLAGHPERTLIAERYLVRQRSLTRQALLRLAEEAAPEDEVAEQHEREEDAVEERISLHEQRHGAVLAALRAVGARSVLDLGTGEGLLLSSLLADRSFERITGMDVSHRSLERAARRLKLDRLPPMQQQRIQLIHGSLTYRDRRLEGYDAATVVEVIEHLDPSRLAAFERVLFEFARPATVVITTPNVEYNVVWENLPAGSLRHRDHRFEWTREEFRRWAERIGRRFGYTVRFLPVGPEHPEYGPPSQMGVFARV